MSERFDAVIFDLGGVVVGSPIDALRDWERELGLARDTINRMIVASGPGGAWSRLERGELSLDDFYPAFEADARTAGLTLGGREMMVRIAAATEPRPQMISAIGRLRTHGLRLAALTNNWIADGSLPGERAETPSERGTRALASLFDAFIESSVVGLRKPDPRIYLLTCERLGVAPERSVFLDDIGHNLKAARALGMTTIKVSDADAALAELGSVLGLTLGTPSSA